MAYLPLPPETQAKVEEIKGYPVGAQISVNGTFQAEVLAYLIKRAGREDLDLVVHKDSGEPNTFFLSTVPGFTIARLEELWGTPADTDQHNQTESNSDINIIV